MFLSKLSDNNPTTIMRDHLCWHLRRRPFEKLLEILQTRFTQLQGKKARESKILKISAIYSHH